MATGYADEKTYACGLPKEGVNNTKTLVILITPTA